MLMIATQGLGLAGLCSFELGGQSGQVIGDEDMERGRSRAADRGPDTALAVLLNLPPLAVAVQQVP